MNKFLMIGVIFLGFVTSHYSKAANVRHIELQSGLTKELNAVLSATNDLHASCVKGDESAIEKNLDEILKAIQNTRRASMSAKQYNRQHLLKILDTANNEVEAAKGKMGSERRSLLVPAFAQIVNLAKIYKTESYKIFFCPKDKTLWLQKATRPQNPFNPDKYGNCGVAVR